MNPDIFSTEEKHAKPTSIDVVIFIKFGMIPLYYETMKTSDAFVQDGRQRWKTIAEHLGLDRWYLVGYSKLELNTLKNCYLLLFPWQHVLLFTARVSLHLIVLCHRL